MTRRRLSPEERDLWQRYSRTAEPLAREGRPPAPVQMSAPVPLPSPQDPRGIDPFEVGQRARSRMATHDLAPHVRDQVAAAPLRMDAKAHKRMKSGKLRPEGKLDLHGLTLAVAQPELTRFLLGAHVDGKRLVLVVTGKGKLKPGDGVMPNRLGVLKHQVPMWLAMPPLSAIVLQVAEAHRSHGGSGAYYVYLRR